MESIMHRGQDGEKDLQSHRSQSKIGHRRKSIMDELDGRGHVIHGTNIALKFKSCVKHGISNSLQHQIL